MNKGRGAYIPSPTEPHQIINNTVVDKFSFWGDRYVYQPPYYLLSQLRIITKFKYFEVDNKNSHYHTNQV
eukprot:SAG31_NODE_9106_length_1333_cov_3.345219_1_plen_69_part_01